MARYRRNHTEKKHALYALVDPVSPPPKPVLISMTGKSGYRFSEYGHAQFERILVEAPGTAPGSEWFIATAIYFHSRRTGTPNIGPKWLKRQCCFCSRKVRETAPEHTELGWPRLASRSKSAECPRKCPRPRPLRRISR